jgi:hypothetical protein
VIYRDDDRELDRALLDVGGMKVGRDAGERKQYRAQKGKNEAHRAIMRKPLVYLEGATDTITSAERPISLLAFTLRRVSGFRLLSGRQRAQ